MRHHRRGLFAAITVGLNFGKGQTAPSWLDNKRYTDLSRRLLANKDIIRMANFASCGPLLPFSFLFPNAHLSAAAFRLWAPRLHGYYIDYNKRLGLNRPFPKSVFSCASFNFGKSVWTFKHRDVRNLPFGWCGVESMGLFDATKGGHLVLWDVKLVIEFPAGALILLPSATIAHSNIPVQDGDERISFTQFTAGDLFRYVDNGFRTQGEVVAADPTEHEHLTKLKESRWEQGLALFSTVDELLDTQ